MLDKVKNALTTVKAPFAEGRWTTTFVVFIILCTIAASLIDGFIMNADAKTSSALITSLKWLLVVLKVLPAFVLATGINRAAKAGAGHLNSSVTLALGIAGRVSRKTAIIFLLVQLIPATLAVKALSWAMWRYFKAYYPASFGMPLPNAAKNISAVENNLLEHALVMVLIWIVIYFTQVKKEIKVKVKSFEKTAKLESRVGWAVGAYVALNALFNSVTGAALNPTVVIAIGVGTGQYRALLYYLPGHIIASIMWGFITRTSIKNAADIGADTSRLDQPVTPATPPATPPPTP